MLAPAAVLFAIMVAHALLETARDALFLSELGADRLAGAYLVMAAAALIAVGLFRRWSRARSPRRMLIAFLSLATAGTIALASLETPGDATPEHVLATARTLRSWLKP